MLLCTICLCQEKNRRPPYACVYARLLILSLHRHSLLAGTISTPFLCLSHISSALKKLTLYLNDILPNISVNVCRHTCRSLTWLPVVFLHNPDLPSSSM